MIKKSIVTLALVSILTLVSSAWAAGTSTNRRGSPPPTASSSSYVSEPYSGGGSSTFSLGFNTGSIGGANLGTQSIGALIGLHSGDLIDIRFAIPTTSPFNFGIGGFYKHVISSHGGAGFHVGGGIALGDVNAGGAAGGNFALAFAGLLGFHFQLPGVSSVSLHFDGGPQFLLITSSPSFTSFATSPLSGVLGASIYYTF